MTTLTPQDIVEYIVDTPRGGNKKYFWGTEHQKITQYLLEHQETDNPDTYAIEYTPTVESGPTLKVFLNKTVQQETKALEEKHSALIRRERATPQNRTNDTAPLHNPFLSELKQAIEQQDYMRIIELKQKMKLHGYEYDQREFSLRNILKKDGKI